MSDSYDDEPEGYDLDEEGDELSRAICAAAIRKGLDPNDYGVVPEAEIVPAAVLARRAGVPTATVIQYRAQERATKRERQLARATLPGWEPGEMEVAEPKRNAIALQFAEPKRFIIPLVLFALSLLSGPLFGLPAWVVVGVLAVSWAMLFSVDNKKK